MKRFILLSFAFMALGFYELSGGADFDPLEAREAAISARAKTSETQGTAARLAEHETPREVQQDTNETAPDVTRTALNLVTFEAATSLPPQPTAPAVAVAQAAGQDDEASEVTEREAVVLPSLAFAGSSVQAASSAVQLPRDIRIVAGISVNMRSGPGTQHDVVTQLGQDTQVEVIQDTGTGWVQLRPVLGGPTGWVADFLLSQS